MFKSPWFFSVSLLVFLSVVSMPLQQARSADDFPYRAKYPRLKVISTNELAKEFGKVIVVDVRSKFEFDVMRIRDAKLVAMSNVEFAERLEKIRKKSDPVMLVFYCNGKTCEKSYEAAAAAEAAGFKNFAVYDAGVFDWVNAHPERGALFGECPVDRSKVIDATGFKAKMLPWSKFQAGAEEAGNIVIDIRDPIQRKKVPKLKDIRSVPLDKLLPVLQTKKLEGDEVFFMDAVGKQVQWLQYHLEREGYKKYWFLEGGVDGLKL